MKTTKTQILFEHPNESSGALLRPQSDDDSQSDDCEDFFICLESVFTPDVLNVRQEYLEIMRQMRHPDHDESTTGLFWKADLVAMCLAWLGIPSNTALHEQPYALARAFPLPLELYQSEFDDEDKAAADIGGNRVLFVLWVLYFSALIRKYQKVGLRGSELTIAVMKRMRVVTIMLVEYFGAADSFTYRLQLTQAGEWFDWFIVTSGCFDPETGNLIERELPLLRELKAIAEREEIIRQHRRRK